MIPLALALSSLFSPAPQVWSVDDDGPADFTDIASAIDAASTGDVILVHPGTYAAFELEKRLSLIGAADPAAQLVQGVTYVSSEQFTITGLRFEGTLSISGVTGRGRLDDVQVSAPSPGADTLILSDADSFEIARTSVTGSARIQGSSVSITSSTFVGADGESGFSCGFSGEDGLDLTNSFAWIADSTFVGGEGGTGGSPCCDGNGGNGIRLDASEALIRGSGASLLEGGFADPFFCGFHGSAVLALGGSRAVISGVGVGPGGLASDGSSTLVAPASDEPWIRITGTDGPGGVRTVEMYGPAGTPLYLAASLGKSEVAVAGLEAPIWLAGAPIAFLQPFQLTGLTTPPTLGVAVGDPALLGLTVAVQGIAPTVQSALVPGAAVVTNPVDLIFQL